MRFGILLLFLTSALSADPIALTILNETTQATASTYMGASPVCSYSGALTAACSASNPGAPGGFGSSAIASINADGGLNFHISAATVGCCGASFGTATMSGTALITGGTGAGYLNMAFSESHDGPGGVGATIIVNGQRSSGVQCWSCQNDWGVFSFDFGQPFTFSFSLEGGADNLDIYQSSSLVMLDARVYTAAPAGCIQTDSYDYGFCSDPNYVSVGTSFGAGGTASIQPAPEPNTALLAMSVGALSLWKLFRRRRDRIVPI